MGVAEQVLAGGEAYGRAALEQLAVELVEARTASSAPAPELPGVGPRPDVDELAGVLARNRSHLWQARQQLYADALDYRQAAEVLGVSDRQVSNLVAAGKLLTIDGPDGKRLPGLQFDLDTSGVRLRGIDRVAAVFAGRVLGLSAWMVTENASLGGRTPAAALADGEIDLVVAVAERG